MKLYTNRRNPVLPPDWHMPDSEAHVMPDGKLYLYGSFDDGKHIYCSSRYHVVSTPDMEHWTIHDCSFDSSRISWAWDPASPRYPGIDWEHPSPFIQKMMREKPGGPSGPGKRGETGGGAGSGFGGKKAASALRAGWHRKEREILSLFLYG